MPQVQIPQCFLTRLRRLLALVARRRILSFRQCAINWLGRLGKATLSVSFPKRPSRYDL